MVTRIDLFKLRDWIIKNDRYVLPPHMEKITGEILARASQRVITLIKGTELWRARKLVNSLFSEQVKLFPPEKMGAPAPGETLESRITPKGIPCLYLALDKKTAAVEVRPSLNIKVQVAPFIAQRDLKILDMTIMSLNLFNRGASEISEDTEVQKFLSGLFALPIDQENHLEYVFTQFMANLFKVRLEVDGLKFTSGQKLGGFNIALFDVESAKIEQPEKMEVKEVTAVLYDMHYEGPKEIDFNKYDPFLDW